MLSCIYRIWGRARCRQLAADWQEAWAHNGVWGGRSGRGPEPLLMELCMDLESASSQRKVAGVSFDLVKAFDRVPRELLGKILGKMGMPGCVLRPYLYMLRKATRRYKLGVCLDVAEPIWGGILQGCPLSMIAMNCVVQIWLAATTSEVPNSFPRSFVDDVAATVIEEDDDTLCSSVRSVYETAFCFVSSIGGELSERKCFTFGNVVVAGCARPGLPHDDVFRLVGGSVAVRAEGVHKPTALELRRFSKWASTVKRARHLPVSWESRCTALLRTRFQGTWGSGTHRLCTTKSHERSLNTIRADVLRCLLRRDRYNASPRVYFALVASPSLSPFYNRVVDGLLFMWRALWATGRFAEVKRCYQQLRPGGNDGPLARLQQVNSLPDFQGVVDDMFACGFVDKPAWLHRIRQQWRQEEFRCVARDRADFKGVERGVLRDETLVLLRLSCATSPAEAGLLCPWDGRYC